MSLQVSIRLSAQFEAESAEIDQRMQRLAAPPGDVWTLTIQEGSKEDEWLLIARAGIQKTEIEPEWSALSIEGKDENLRCTYARVARGVEREAGSLVRSVERLLTARSIRVARPRRVSVPRGTRGTSSSSL
ncbi:MAG: hypothetical protein ABW221_24260 [Vicinamibacteria bacterium]